MLYNVMLFYSQVVFVRRGVGSLVGMLFDVCLNGALGFVGGAICILGYVFILRWL